MYDIITFGSATRDIFLRSKNFKIVGEKKFITGKGICLSLGSKIEVENIYFLTGGGGTNTATTFAHQGFKTAFCGMIGKDLAGKEIKEELNKNGIDARFVLVNPQKPTNQSVILFSSKEQERTILVYRGASTQLTKKDIPFERLKTGWFYLAPLAGKAAQLTEAIVDFAVSNKTKVALNPGNSQLTLPQRTRERIFAKIDILILNQEEASLLTKIPYKKEKEVFKKIDEICPGIAIMTKGPDGVVVSDGEYLYSARPPETRVVDRTGAGDAFGAGFVSGFIRSHGDIEFAIQLGMTNASACLEKIGAKAGLLKKRQKWQKIKVQKKRCK